MKYKMFNDTFNIMLDRFVLVYWENESSFSIVKAKDTNGSLVKGEIREIGFGKHKYEWKIAAFGEFIILPPT